MRTVTEYVVLAEEEDNFPNTVSEILVTRDKAAAEAAVHCSQGEYWIETRKALEYSSLEEKLAAEDAREAADGIPF